MAFLAILLLYTKIGSNLKKSIFYIDKMVLVTLLIDYHIKNPIKKYFFRKIFFAYKIIIYNGGSNRGNLRCGKPIVKTLILPHFLSLPCQTEVVSLSLKPLFYHTFWVYHVKLRWYTILDRC